MQFPLSVLNKDDYCLAINKLLNDKDCILIIDTNILATLFRLQKSARTEFFNWIKPLIDSNRVKTPVWVLNEYTNRFIRKQTKDYLSGGDKLTTINKDFAEIKKFLMMHVDPSSLPSIGYPDQQAYNDDINDVTLKLGKLLKSLKNKKSDYTVDVHNELQSCFQNTILESDIFQIIDKIRATGPIRYDSQLPPGFKDNKELNSFGDLVIWEEILSYVKKNKITKTIIITNDGKQDWQYAPLQITTKGRTINNNPEFKIADPRLVYEFKLATKSNELYIINFELLTQILIDNGNIYLYQLAKALQLVKEEDESAKVDEEVIAEATNLAAYEIEQLEIAPKIAGEIIENTDNRDANKTLSYDFRALADSQYSSENSIVNRIVQTLKTYDWYRQNPAIDELIILLRSNYIEAKNDLFVLGRNIYQAACGGSYAAIQFLQNLIDNSLNFLEHIKLHIVTGMFYELYFDSKNIFRKGKFKTSFLDELFKLQFIDEYQLAIEFIERSLMPYRNFLLLVPSKKLSIIEFNIELEKAIEDFIDYIVTSIKVNGEELLVNSQNFFLQQFPTFFDSNSLKEYITKIFAIPYGQQKLTFNIDVDEYHTLRIRSGFILWRGALAISS